MTTDKIVCASLAALFAVIAACFTAGHCLRQRADAAKFADSAHYERIVIGGGL